MPRPSCWPRSGTRAFASSAGRTRDSRARSTARWPWRASRSWCAASCPGASRRCATPSGSAPRRACAGGRCGAGRTPGGARSSRRARRSRSRCPARGAERSAGREAGATTCSSMVGVRILITGITGFVGSQLAEYALAQGTEVVGALRWRSKTEHIEHLRDRISLFESDLRDLLSVRALLEQARADYIVHLAAQSFVVASWTTPSETLWTNAICQLNLFEGMRQLGSKARFIVIGSSEEYGLVYPDELPIRETNPLRPRSPYPVSKVTQDLMGWQYFKSSGVHIVRARAFNHDGPRRGESFATSNFAKQIAEIEAGLREVLVSVPDRKPTLGSP